MASRYWVTAGTSNWSTSGAGSGWSLTDGGAGGQVKPTASDDVFFTANSPVCTVDTAGVGLTLNFTGYASTITMTAGLTISGSVTLVSAMTIAGASGLAVNATATLTSNGKTWPNALTLTGTSTMTLADDWNVDELLTIGASTLSTTINGGTIYAGAGYTVGGTTGNVTGTSRIVMDGTGTINMSAKTTGTHQLEILIDTTGTCTIGTLVQTVNPIRYKRGLLAGNIVGFPKTVFKLA